MPMIKTEESEEQNGECYDYDNLNTQGNTSLFLTIKPLAQKKGECGSRAEREQWHERE